MTRTRTANQHSGVVSNHAEGPIWMPAGAALWLVDLLAGDIVSLDSVGAVIERHLGGTVAAAFRPRTTGASSWRLREAPRSLTNRVRSRGSVSSGSNVESA